MEINRNTRINELLALVPETNEFLYPFRNNLPGETTLGEVAGKNDISLTSLITGVERYIKRAIQGSFNVEEMRKRLIRPDAVNIAGYVNFLWQEAFVHEIEAKAKELGIKLNLNIFPKHLKRQFQNYLAVCNSPDDLPEMLIGKGFSSLMTSRFIDRFVRPGYYRHNISGVPTGNIFTDSGFRDDENDFHPFGIDELVMIYDKSHAEKVKSPGSWADLLKPEYNGMLSQMGKNHADHFGFIILLYIFESFGEEGIRQYAGNIKTRQHFTYTIRNMGKSSDDTAPVNILHQYATVLIRSDSRDKAMIIDPTEGNPGACHFYLLKESASEKAAEMARHLYSPEIRSIMEKCGTTHITSDTLVSNNSKIRWIGWDKVKHLQMPYMKEYLSEIAHDHYRN